MRSTLARVAAAMVLGFALGGPTARAADPDPKRWDHVVAAARGQTVYWNAWAGDPRVNEYIAWVGVEVKARYGVTLEHVKLSDTAEAVSKVVAEKAAGRATGGTVDLIWINGPNFAKLKEAGLLFGPWAESLPSFKYVDVEGKPAVRSDFTIPTDGFEAPWNMAQIVFFYDGARVRTPPRSAKALLAWAKANPGRFAFPDPSNFLGVTFMKQALSELTPDKARLLAPATDADFERVMAPLWAYLDELTPALWRAGRAYPKNGPELRRLMGDGEIDVGLSFNPAEASAAIARKEIPDSVRTLVFDGGTIGNASFVAIPFNAANKAGALVVSEFLLSPAGQLKKQDPEGFGGFTVLAMSKLSSEERAAFAAQKRGVATLSTEELGAHLPEPHPSWMTRATAAWKARYGVR
ncbi:MAG: ABC transporter substrate-binding protein [Rhodospirillales bacterium]|nr:MAG: ABC transporter substrate-binding protein [Rhodospirillales bacterium]